MTAAPRRFGGAWPVPAGFGPELLDAFKRLTLESWERQVQEAGCVPAGEPDVVLFDGPPHPTDLLQENGNPVLDQDGRPVVEWSCQYLRVSGLVNGPYGTGQ